MNKIYEEKKIDVGMVAQVIDNSNVTGAYFPMAGYRSLIAIMNIGAMVKAKTAIMQLMQATNAQAGSAKVVTVGACTLTSNELCTALQVTLATVLNTETIDITVTKNGVSTTYTFTGHTDTTTLADREFSISGNDTADAVEFCLCVNDPVYGVPGVLAESALGVVQLTSESPGVVTIGAVSSDATFTVVTVEGQSYVEIDPAILDNAGGFDHVAIKITSTATGSVSATLIRGKFVKKVNQAVGANYPA